MDRAVQQRFGVALNGGERRAELMRDIDDEILADALQAFRVRRAPARICSNINCSFSPVSFSLVPSSPNSSLSPSFNRALEIAARQAAGVFDDAARRAER